MSPSQVHELDCGYVGCNGYVNILPGVNTQSYTISMIGGDDFYAQSVELSAGKYVFVLDLTCVFPAG